MDEAAGKVGTHGKGRSWTVSSTEAQNNFGAVLSRVSAEGRVFITRYQRPEAVVLSMDEYRSLTGEAPVDLAALEEEFDMMVDHMQTDHQRTAVDGLFSAGPDELGEAAVVAAARMASEGSDENVAD